MLNIGFISAWLHRGSTYVTINYMKMLSQYNLFVYARGGEYFDNSFKMEKIDIYKAKRLEGTRIDSKELINWIDSNKIDIIIVNEQDEVAAICKAKIKRPHVIIGAYIDYYTEKTVENYRAYDFLICNTKRHYSVFEWHPQCYYLPWCVDTNLYKPEEKQNREITFFHSMGMSDRKGTDILIKTFIKNDLGKKSRLVIHTQRNISNLISVEQAEKNNIQIVEKTVPAPGLYYMGDIYVYPTKLDGLGLTMYEALSCGMPVIVTNDAPMNEIVNNERGKLVEVSKFTARSDGYYWPLAYASENSLYKNMKFYIDNPTVLEKEKSNARQFALNNLAIKDCQKKLNDIISNIHNIDNLEWCERYIEEEKKQQKIIKKHEIIDLFFPKFLEAKIREKLENSRRIK